MTAMSLRAHVAPGAGLLRQAAGAADLDGAGAGPSRPTVDDGVGHGGMRSLGSLGFASFFPYEESRKHPMGACKGSAMYLVDVILIMKRCRCLSCPGLVPPF